MRCRRSLRAHSMRASLRAIVLCLAAPALAGAQARSLDRSADSVRGERVVVTPGAKYRAGWLHRAILGADYRDLWTTPIEVELLDLHTEAGGLTPTSRGGSMQTVSLRFDARNGREYVFRPLEKDFTRGLPPELRETLVRDIAQDQVAGYHPAAPLVVSRLLDATGIRHPRPRLFVMPDDPLLGEFRAEFRGVLGTFEERPDDDFDETPNAPGASNVVSSERLFERMLESHRDVPDRRAYLAARLFDILVGDRDRHRDQWRWGRFSRDRDALWEPIPRDRDMPFALFEGLGPRLVRGFAPQMVTFGPRYPDMVWLNWNAREIDRRLLAALDRATWDSTAAALQRRISDAVIDSALATMPVPFQHRNGAELRAALIQRRERLPDAARAFYRVLSTEVDLSGTNDADHADITRHSDGSVQIAVSPADSARKGSAYLQRLFRPEETREVRVYLHGGNDGVLVRGAAAGAILVRIIGGDGSDVVIDSVPGGDGATRFYDSAGENRLESPGKAPIDSRPYTAPTTARVEHAVRDWGTWSFTRPGGSFAPVIGVLGSVSHTRFAYGFRRNPFASRQVLRLDVAFGVRRPRLVYDATVMGFNSRRSTELRLTASGLELIRFHGLGNETVFDQDDDYYRVLQNMLRAEPAVVLPVSRRTTLSLGAVVQYTSTRDDEETLVSTSNPYGSGSFGEAGLKATVALDHRDSPIAPRKGLRVSAETGVFPALLSVEQTFGLARVAASTYLSPPIPLEPTLAIRVGGQHAWGRYPFHDAAFLGGASTLRGWDEQRFAGRSAIYANGELRLRTGKVSLVVPADMGLIALGDLGRVYADGERSDRWHSSLGGGLWIAPLMRPYTVSVTVARGRERTSVYLRNGFAF
jgi:hypothetical protein